MKNITIRIIGLAVVFYLFGLPLGFMAADDITNPTYHGYDPNASYAAIVLIGGFIGMILCFVAFGIGIALAWFTAMTLDS